MSSAQALRLEEVDALRQARLEAQQYRFQLEQAQNELSDLRQQVGALAKHQQQQPAAPHPANCRCVTAALAADELQEARLQAADSRYKLQLTELELAKQLDALQELQWQLDCVVAQLGLQGGGGNGGPAAAGTAAAGTPSAGGEVWAPAVAAGGVDHMLLLGKVEELRMAQLQLEEHKRRLAVTEAQLASTQARCDALQQQQQRQPHHGQQQRQEYGAGVAVPAGAEDVAAGPHSSELGVGGKELVGELLQENHQLRQRLADAEEQYRGLERDYEVELLIRAEAADDEAAGGGNSRSGAAAPGSRAGVPPQDAAWQLTSNVPQPDSGSMLGRRHMVERRRGSNSSGSEQGPHRRPLVPLASQAGEPAARQRLKLRLQEKDKQLGKLRVVVKELEGKLIDAYKHQADMAMKESSWREQEAQDRRIAQLDEDRARLAFEAQAAQAEAEAARREAAVQRRLAKRLQQRQVGAAGGQDGGGGCSGHMVDLLQKRVKVLEAQNIKLRLQARTNKEEEELVAAEAAAAARRAQRSQGGGGGARSASEPALGSEVSKDGTAGAAGAEGAADNGSPNRAAAAAGGGSGSAGSSMLDGNPVLERWQADKRLQKRVETLQAKLRDKITALVSAQAGRSRAEEQVQQLQAQLLQCQAGTQQLQAALRQAEQRSLPGTMVPVAQHRDLMRQLEAAHQQYDALERRHAELQQRLPGAGGVSSSEDTAGADADSSGLPATVNSNRAAYCPAAYGGSNVEVPPTALAAPPADPQAQLLQKDVQLFDAQLQRDQAVAEADRQRRRLHALLDVLSPHPHDEAAAAAIAEARELAGLAGGSAAASAAVGNSALGAAGHKPAGKVAAGGAAGTGARRGKPSGAGASRERELLDTIELLKAALERTQKGLESGVSSSKYMAAVERAKQLKAQCQGLEEQLQDAGKAREELARVQRELGALHGTCSGLRSQLKAAREQREEAASVREHMLCAQVSELERTLRERDAQMQALNEDMAQVGEEVRVLVAEGLRPADLIQELLVLRPQVRDLDERCQELSAELAGFDAAAFEDGLDQLKAQHELLRQQCTRWEGEVRGLCARHGEPLPAGLAAEAGG